MAVNVNNLAVEVFSPQLQQIAPLERRTGLRWTDKYTSCGDFEIWCPITERNSELLQKDNIIWIGGDSAGIIEYIEKDRDEQSNFSFHVKGRFLDSILEGRVVIPQYSGGSKTACQHMLSLLDKYCINPTDEARKIPYLVADTDVEDGTKISYQQTGGSILSELEALSNANTVGFSVDFDPYNKQLIFKAKTPANRTWNQSENDPVVFDSASDDILDSNYTVNWSNGRNVAYVAGEGEGSARKIVLVTNQEVIPLEANRKELWVDARDLQSQRDNGTTMTAAQYEELLHQRGLQRLAEYQYIESFSSTIKTFGFEQNVLGKDFFLGDFVTVIDRELGVTMDTQITEVEQTWDEKGYRLDITFGAPQPTLLDVVKRM